VASEGGIVKKKAESSANSRFRVLSGHFWVDIPACVSIYFPNEFDGFQHVWLWRKFSMKPMSTILIVDDEPGARDTLEALLHPEGYNLNFACNGREALKQAEALTPSLILLDVMMPEMDGFEVCRQLRSRPLIAEVPIILITALDDRDSRLQGIEAGADDFLSKSFDFNELRARVRSIVRLDRYLFFVGVIGSMYCPKSGTFFLVFSMVDQ